MTIRLYRLPDDVELEVLASAKRNLFENCSSQEYAQVADLPCTANPGLSWRLAPRFRAVLIGYSMPLLFYLRGGEIVSTCIIDAQIWPENDLKKDMLASLVEVWPGGRRFWECDAGISVSYAAPFCLYAQDFAWRVGCEFPAF